jgi:hypothetical protein
MDADMSIVIVALAVILVVIFMPMKPGRAVTVEGAIDWTAVEKAYALETRGPRAPRMSGGRAVRPSPTTAVETPVALSSYATVDPSVTRA